MSFFCGNAPCVHGNHGSYMVARPGTCTVLLILSPYSVHISTLRLLLAIILPLKTHYSDVIMGQMASKITSITIIYSTLYWGVCQRKHQRSASLALSQEFSGDRWIPRTNGQKHGKLFHMMTSSRQVCLRRATKGKRHTQPNCQRVVDTRAAAIYEMCGLFWDFAIWNILHLCTENFKKSRKTWWCL